MNTPKEQSICLCMIVKNESQVIRRCLDSVRSLISHWVIVDTGSTDGTQDIIRSHLQSIPGTLHESPWQDFAHNRSEALRLARPHGSYSLVIDADDLLELAPDFEMPGLTLDGYSFNICDGSHLYPRTQLVNNRLAWYYRGVLHEFITCDDTSTGGHLDINMRRLHDGARRKDPTIFLKDAEIFEKALQAETDSYLRSRYTFYLAQSYKDARQPAKALENYLKRASLGGWVQEVFYSYYQAGRQMEELNYADDMVLGTYQLATNALPERLEAAHAASRYCRIKKLYQRGYDIAKTSLGRPMVPGALFGEPVVYESGLLDEFSVNAYWIGNYVECLDACLMLLESGKMASTDLPRVFANARYALRQIASLSPSPQRRA